MEGCLKVKEMKYIAYFSFQLSPTDLSAPCSAVRKSTGRN
jgi:hypothetical protein